MRKLSIGLDADGVISDFDEGFRRWRHEVKGIPRASMPAPDLWGFPNWGFQGTEFFEDLKAALTDRFYATMPVFPDVAAGVTRLREAGHEVHVVTARCIGHHDAIPKWDTALNFATHGIEIDSLTFSSDKTILPVDVFLEDNDKNYAALVAAGIDTYLRTHAYNSHVEVPADHRVPDFTTFVDRVLASA